MPIFELWLLFQAGARIGALNTVAVVLITGIVGAAMAKSQGLSLLAQMQEQQRRGELPAESMIQGFLVLAGGLLLLTPGFVTDALGFSMVMPLTRIIYARLLKVYFLRKIQSGSVQFYSNMSHSGFQQPYSPAESEIKDAKVTQVRDVTPEKD